jgi:O-antigen/teichoic acid export membrane protein
MIIQVGTLFLFSSDNYILAYFFGPKEIVPYEIVTKYFQFPLMILTAGMAPLWSLFANKYLENNKTWLKISFRKFNSYYPLLLLGIALCLLFANPIMKIWISNDFFAPHFLLIMVAILTSLRIFTTFYSYFFNGIGNLKSYLILLSLSVVLKIPLSYLFIRLNFGISSVVLSS